MKEVICISEKTDYGAYWFVEYKPIQELVRCKNCIYRRNVDNWCSVFENFIEDDEFFCADGESEGIK